LAVRYDPVLIAGLVEEIRARWVGRRMDGLRLDRRRREAWLLTSASTTGEAAIGFLLHPELGFILGREVAPPGVDAPGRTVGFRRLYLSAAWSPEDERLLVLDLAGGLRDTRPELPPVYRLCVELHTNQWNAVLVRGRDDRIEEVLWPRVAGGRSLLPGATYARPESARSWAEAPPDADDWRRLLGPVDPGRRRATLLDSVAWCSSINVDWILGEAAHGDGEDALAAALDRYLELRTRTGKAWLNPRAATSQPYPVALGPAAQPCRSLLDAMGTAAQGAGLPADVTAAASREGGGPAPSPEAERLEHAIRRRIRDLTKRRDALERQLAGESPEQLRAQGHLLLARKAEVPRGSERVSLPGFDGSEVVIRLDPRLDVIRNAERLYDRARRRERAVRAIPGLVRRAQSRIDRLESALVELATSGPSGPLRELAGGDPGESATSRSGAPQADRESLPYRTYRSSGGLEIRVGRSSRANDELTFGHSAPEDIWLHARQAAGAHVILRWDRREQNPPLADLTEAAVLAAVHSEARHSGMVPVDWTRRKHVRKPRKSAPGVVVPERVSTLFVEPDPSAPRRLSPEA